MRSTLPERSARDGFGVEVAIIGVNRATAALPHFFLLCFSAAPMNAANSGCAWFGFD
jgi:hypothetical protein